MVDDAPRSAADASASEPVPRGVRWVRGDGALRIEFEPAGVLVGSRGLAVASVGAALPALGLTIATTLVSIRQLESAQPNFLNSGGLVLVAFALGCLWLFVGLTAFYAFDLGRRRTTIGIVRDTLLVERRGPAGTRRVVVPLDDLLDVSVALDFGVLHQRQHDVLRLDVRDRPPVVLLRERPRTEIEWVRDRLRAAVGGGAVGRAAAAQ